MMKAFKVLIALGLAVITCAFVLLPNISSAQPRLEVLQLPEEYLLSATVGRDQPAFHLLPQRGGFRTSNIPQALTADFTDNEVIIQSGLIHWDWQVQAYGYGDILKTVMPAEPTASFNRVEYRRGPISEWYINGPLGLQQGFDLMVPPPVERTTGPLTLLINLSGNGKAELAGEDRHLRLTDTANKPVLDYVGLLAYDAVNHKLPAWLELEAGQLRLRVNDYGAVYPLHIDPWMQKASLTPDDGKPFERFGNKVAISDDTAFIGMRDAVVNNNNSQGAVYIFAKPGGHGSIGGWDSSLPATAKLTVDDGTAGDQFGFAVASSGDTLVVTAANHDDYRGAAYIFVKPEGGWVTTSTYTAKLTASEATRLEGFGWSVGISGDTIVVGAQDDDGQGAAYVFVKPEGGWVSTSTYTARLTASDSDALRFGAAVDMSGNTIIVGAYASRVGDNGNQGAAYLFVKPEGGWSDNLNETAKLTVVDGQANDWFADTVAISNKTVVIGTRYANSSFGATYVYEQPLDGWVTTSSYTARLIASDVISHGFGNSVDIDGDAIVVGAVFSDDKDTNRNSAYVFDRPPSGWVTTSTYTARLTPVEGMPYDSFGQAVAINGRTIVIGAEEADIGENYNQGAAYIYELQPDLIVNKTVSPIIAGPGQPVNYTLQFSNTGSTIATNIVLTNIIPAGISVQSISSNGAVITNVTGAGVMTQYNSNRAGASLEMASASLTFNWLVQNLAPNRGGVIIINGTVSPFLSYGSLVATTIITSPGDTNPINNIRNTMLMVAKYRVHLPLITKKH